MAGREKGIRRKMPETEKRVNKKPYELGILVGRFQTLHLGHEMIIRKALELCEEVGLFIGSSQESGTNKNPFSYELRKEIIETALGEELKIFPLPDIGIGNVPAWGDYVLKNVYDRFGKYPDLLITGKEGRRIDWFDNAKELAISELYVPKSIDISGTQMRDFFVNDDRESWQSYVSPNNWKNYDRLRSIVLSSCENMETRSV